MSNDMRGGVIDAINETDQRGVGRGAMLEPMGVYIHWPFCAQKCPYCDFNSHVRVRGWDEDAFLKAYLSEMATFRRRTGPRRVMSIFFGGGTPSLMAASTVGALIDAVCKTWSVDEDAEISLEANPGSVEAGRFRGYRTAGVNRVSVGVQSLNPADLRKLGRVHSVDEARAAVALANDVFNRVSFDLIYARQQQTLSAWERELSEALAMAAGHLSLYQLTIEPGTPYARWHRRGRLRIPNDDLASQFYQLTQQMTAAAGLRAYETSNHARPGEESRHNLVYWRYLPYVGIGPGAHGRPEFIDAMPRADIAPRVATSIERTPEDWVERVVADGHGLIEEEPLSTAEVADEMVLMGLRLREGLNLTRLQRLTGRVIDSAALDDLGAEQFVRIERRIDPITGYACDFLVVLEAGRFVLDRIVLHVADALVRPRNRAANEFISA
ncbi:MAG: radical SAM family heme chaperone HemW [Pseudomonadota bacterium]